MFTHDYKIVILNDPQSSTKLTREISKEKTEFSIKFYSNIFYQNKEARAYLNLKQVHDHT